MKNLILKWLGVSPWAINDFEGDGRLPSAVSHIVREQMAKQREENVDLVMNRLNNSYDIDGMSSKVDDMHWQIQDLEGSEGRWNDAADKMEELDSVDLDKVQELDDRLTELLAGYKLEVKLTQENY